MKQDIILYMLMIIGIYLLLYVLPALIFWWMEKDAYKPLPEAEADETQEYPTSAPETPLEGANAA